MANFSVPRPHFAGIIGAVVTLGGLLTSPEILGMIPAKYSTAVIALGTVIQAFTKPVHAGATDLVPQNPQDRK